jgi:hypothetical protein
VNDIQVFEDVQSGDFQIHLEIGGESLRQMMYIHHQKNGKQDGQVEYCHQWHIP